MIEIAMIKTVIDIASSLMNMAGKFSDKDQRDAVSKWMLDIAALVKDVADKLNEGEYPHGACAEMQVYVDRFPQIVGNLMSHDDMEKIHKLLQNAQELEMIHAQISQLTTEEKTATIQKLKVAAGTIAGQATLIRLGY